MKISILIILIHIVFLAFEGATVGYCFLKFRMGKFYWMNQSLSKRIKTAACCVFFLSAAVSQPGEVSKTKLYVINDNKYISALEYADSQNIHTSFYEDKEKLEFRFQNSKIIIVM